MSAVLSETLAQEDSLLGAGKGARVAFTGRQLEFEPFTKEPGDLYIDNSLSRIKPDAKTAVWNEAFWQFSQGFDQRFNQYLDDSEKLNDGNSRLLVAAALGRLDLVHALCQEKDIKLNVTNKAGNTPLLMAAANGQLEVVKYLMRNKKTSPWMRNRYNASAAMLAVINNHYATVEWLLTEGGASPDDNTGAPVNKSLLNLASPGPVKQLIQGLLAEKASQQGPPKFDRKQAPAEEKQHTSFDYPLPECFKTEIKATKKFQYAHAYFRRFAELRLAQPKKNGASAGDNFLSAVYQDISQKQAFMNHQALFKLLQYLEKIPAYKTKVIDTCIAINYLVNRLTQFRFSLLSYEKTAVLSPADRQQLERDQSYILRLLEVLNPVVDPVGDTHLESDSMGVSLYMNWLFDTEGRYGQSELPGEWEDTNKLASKNAELTQCIAHWQKKGLKFLAPNDPCYISGHITSPALSQPASAEPEASVYGSDAALWNYFASSIRRNFALSDALASSAATPTVKPKLAKWLRENSATADVNRLAEALQEAKLTTLSLRIPHTKPKLEETMGDGGAIILALALAENSMLKTLDASWQSISDIGIKSLAKMLETNQTITQLNLYGNTISEAGGRALANALENNTRLLKINLSGRVSAQTLERITTLLERNAKLTPEYLHEQDQCLLGAGKAGEVSAGDLQALQPAEEKAAEGIFSKLGQIFTSSELTEEQRIAILESNKLDRLLLEKSSGKPKEKREIKFTNSPLLTAAALGRLDLVRSMCKDLAPKDQNQAGNTTLHMAAANGQFEVVQWLITHKKADTSLLNKHNATALMLAIINNHYAIVEYLLPLSPANHTLLDLARPGPVKELLQAKFGIAAQASAIPAVMPAIPSKDQKSEPPNFQNAFANKKAACIYELPACLGSAEAFSVSADIPDPLDGYTGLCDDINRSYHSQNTASSIVYFFDGQLLPEDEIQALQSFGDQLRQSLLLAKRQHLKQELIRPTKLDFFNQQLGDAGAEQLISTWTQKPTYLPNYAIVTVINGMFGDKAASPMPGAKTVNYEFMPGTKELRVAAPMAFKPGTAVNYEFDPQTKGLKVGILADQLRYQCEDGAFYSLLGNTTLYCEAIKPAGSDTFTATTKTNNFSLARNYFLCFCNKRAAELRTPQSRSKTQSLPGKIYDEILAGHAFQDHGDLIALLEKLSKQPTNQPQLVDHCVTRNYLLNRLTELRVALIAFEQTPKLGRADKEKLHEDRELILRLLATLKNAADLTHDGQDAEKWSKLNADLNTGFAYWQKKGLTILPKDHPLYVTGRNFSYPSKPIAMADLIASPHPPVKPERKNSFAPSGSSAFFTSSSSSSILSNFSSSSTSFSSSASSSASLTTSVSSARATPPRVKRPF